MMIKKHLYYHFLCSKYAIDDLEKKRIRVSLIDQLNDPFELLPYLRYDNFDKRQDYHKIRHEVSKKYGLLCFSNSWEEPILWGHYADKHKGVAIGFEILKDKPIEVKYATEAKRVGFELGNDNGQNEKLFLSLAEIKYEKWAYEKEYRVLVNLSDCINEGGHYFLKFQNRLNAKKIILGCKFDDNEEKNKLIKSAEDLNATIIASRQGWEDYKIRQCGTKTKNLQDKGDDS